MHWKIIGARRNTGEDVVIVVAADDEAAARHAARRRGVLVAELRPVRIRKTNRVVAAPAATVTAAGHEPVARALEPPPDPAITGTPQNPFADATPIAASVVEPAGPAADPTPPPVSVTDVPVDGASFESVVPADAAPSADGPGDDPPAFTAPGAAGADQAEAAGVTTDAHDAATPEGAPQATSGDAVPAPGVAPGPAPAGRAPSRVQVRRAAGVPLTTPFAEMLSVPRQPPRPTSRRAANRHPGAGPVRPPNRRTAGRAGRRAPLLAHGLALGLALGTVAVAGIVAIRLLGDSPSPRVARAALVDGDAARAEKSGADHGATLVAASDAPRPEGVDREDDAVLRSDAEPPRARHGPIEVVLVSAAMQRAAGPSRLTARLVVAVRVRNGSPTATLLYRPWSGGDAAPYALPVRLRDDEGREYPLKGIDFGREAPGLGAELRPGDAATDVLTFLPPGETFTSLELELPPENVGGKGPFPLRLQIPASAVAR